MFLSASCSLFHKKSYNNNKVMPPNNIPTTDIDINHHIQRGIIMRLRQGDPLGYAQLKPSGVEGNAYNYHLRLLKKSGLIELRDDSYHLTHTGHLVSDAFSFASQRLMLRPHHYTTLLITQDDSVLVYIPILGAKQDKLGLPSGKLHYGDSIEQSMAREMERRDLSSDYTYSEISSINIRYLQDGQIVLHRPGVLWHVSYSGECKEFMSERGRTKWMPIREVVQSRNALPELLYGLERLESAPHTSIDLEYPLD